MQTKLKKTLSMPALLTFLGARFARVKDGVTRQGSVDLSDYLMSAFAVFSLKYPSLLEFDEGNRHDAGKAHNLKSLYKIKEVPSDTAMRERLDAVDPSKIRPAFKVVLALLQHSGLFKAFEFYEGHYLVALDGTGCFSSDDVHCENCCEKHHRDGRITYYHQMLSGVIVHPDMKVVLPICPEPILKQDGSNKNDCERNAAKRLISDLRREHPHLKIIITEDSLASNAPHIRHLRAHKMSFILGAKQTDHQWLFDYVNASHPVEYVVTQKEHK